MKSLTLIGFPLGHSFSQRYFEAKFKKEGIDGWRYHNSPIEDIEELRQVVTGDDTLVGFNVTIPHKQSVMRFLDEIDRQAKEIGAVNCVKVVRKEGFVGKIVDGVMLKGYNTDFYGFRDSLLGMIGDKRPSALVLGTGGASKAVCHALTSLGIDYVSVSRRKSESAVSYDEVDSRMIAEHLLIVNATPLGMYPKTDAAPSIDYGALTREHMLFDLVYNPGDTLFLRHGRRAGATVCGGYGMLVGQAEMGWKIFNE